MGNFSGGTDSGGSVPPTSWGVIQGVSRVISLTESSDCLREDSHVGTVVRIVSVRTAVRLVPPRGQLWEACPSEDTESQKGHLGHCGGTEEINVRVSWLAGNGMA